MWVFRWWWCNASWRDVLVLEYICLFDRPCRSAWRSCTSYLQYFFNCYVCIYVCTLSFLETCLQFGDRTHTHANHTCYILHTASLLSPTLHSSGGRSWRVTNSKVPVRRGIYTLGRYSTYSLAALYVGGCPLQTGFHGGFPGFPSDLQDLQSSVGYLKQRWFGTWNVVLASTALLSFLRSFLRSILTVFSFFPPTPVQKWRYMHACRKSARKINGCDGHT